MVSMGAWRASRRGRSMSFEGRRAATGAIAEGADGTENPSLPGDLRAPFCCPGTTPFLHQAPAAAEQGTAARRTREASQTATRRAAENWTRTRSRAERKILDRALEFQPAFFRTPTPFAAELRTPRTMIMGGATERFHCGTDGDDAAGERVCELRSASCEPLMQACHSCSRATHLAGSDELSVAMGERTAAQSPASVVIRPIRRDGSCVPSTRVRREPLMQACHSCSRPTHLAGSNERVVAMGGWTAARSQASVVASPIRHDGSCVPSTRVWSEPLMQACHSCSRPTAPASFLQDSHAFCRDSGRQPRTTIMGGATERFHFMTDGDDAAGERVCELRSASCEPLMQACPLMQSAHSFGWQRRVID